MIIFSTTVAITIYVNSDTTMLGILKGNYDVGLYSTSVKIYTLVKKVLVAILTVMIPRFSLMLNTDNLKSARDFFNDVFNVLTMFLMPMSVGLFMVSNSLICALFGNEYIGATVSLRILSIASIFSLYAYMYTQCVLIPIKKESVVFKATLISAIANVVLNFAFIPLIGIDGAATTTLISEIIVFIIVLKEGANTIGVGSFWENNSSVIIGCVGIVIACQLISFFKLNSFLTLVLDIALSMIAYFVLLLFLKNKIVINGLNKIMRRIKTS